MERKNNHTLTLPSYVWVGGGKRRNPLRLFCVFLGSVTPPPNTKTIFC